VTATERNQDIEPWIRRGGDCRVACMRLHLYHESIEEGCVCVCACVCCVCAHTGLRWRDHACRGHEPWTLHTSATAHSSALSRAVLWTS